MLDLWFSLFSPQEQAMRRLLMSLESEKGAVAVLWDEGL